MWEKDTGEGGARNEEKNSSSCLYTPFEQSYSYGLRQLTEAVNY